MEERKEEEGTMNPIATRLKIETGNVTQISPVEGTDPLYGMEFNEDGEPVCECKYYIDSGNISMCDDCKVTYLSIRPERERPENTTWVMITPEDTCAWELKEAHLEEEPDLETAEMYVGGWIEEIPQSWLMDGLCNMLVNEEGRIDKLPHNQLATQLLDRDVEVVGNALVEWDSKYNDKKGWMIE